MTTLEVGGIVDQTVQGKYRIQGKIAAKYLCLRTKMDRKLEVVGSTVLQLAAVNEMPY